jgi:hypothetical protein
VGFLTVSDADRRGTLKLEYEDLIRLRTKDSVDVCD